MPSILAVPSVAAPAVKVTVPEVAGAPNTETLTETLPCHPETVPFPSATQVPVVDVEAHRVFAGVGVVKVTTGGVPTVTVHGDINAPLLPAASVALAVTWLAPRKKVTVPKLAKLFAQVVTG